MATSSFFVSRLDVRIGLACPCAEEFTGNGGPLYDPAKLKDTAFTKFAEPKDPATRVRRIEEDWHFTAESGSEDCYLRGCRLVV